MNKRPHTLMIQLLEWLAERPRTYADTMEAWRTSCPRFAIWEDAYCDELVTVGPIVSLSDRGRNMLERFRADAP
jgi:hypothetical protein